MKSLSQKRRRWKKKVTSRRRALEDMMELKQIDDIDVKAHRFWHEVMQEKLPQGRIFKETMIELDREIITLEERIEKLQAQRTVEEMSANAGEFLCSNIRFAMQHLDQAPPEAQKSLLLALIKEIIVYDDRIEIKMFIDQSVAESLPSEIANTFQIDPKDPQKAKRPTNNSEALNADGSGSSERQVWLLGLGSNQQPSGYSSSQYFYWVWTISSSYFRMSGASRAYWLISSSLSLCTFSLT